jgi:hypothetical protein
MTDATSLVKQLDMAAIRLRLDEIEAERKALVVLLRAAQAKERRKPKQGGTANAQR